MLKLALFILALTISFAVMRFVVPAKGLDLTAPTIFKDLAHVYVGGLLATGAMGGLILYLFKRELSVQQEQDLEGIMDEVITFCFALGIMGITLTGIEIIAALVK